MIYLKNCNFFDENTLTFVQTDILVESGLKAKLHLYKKKPPQLKTEEELDCRGMLIMHSFANGHHHAYSALARGMHPPRKNPGNFYEVLQYIWWTLDKCLDKDLIRASALATAIACAKSGVTFVADHHSSPYFIKKSLEIIADAFDEVGISHLLCYEISDRDGFDKVEKALSETENYLKKHQGLVGLHASFTVSDATIRKAVDLAGKYNSGIHIHVAEDEYDQQHCIQHFNKRVIERLHDAGILKFSKSILAHCLHINENERNLIAQSPCWVVENKESNLNNKVGSFNSNMLGENIMLGTDGMHSDMLQSSKAAFLTGRGNEDVSATNIYLRFRNVNRYIRENHFSGDADNNLVILDYDSPTEINNHNFSGHFIYGFSSNHIRHVISNGNFIVKDRKILTVDENEILKFTRSESLKLWEKMRTI